MTGSSNNRENMIGENNDNNKNKNIINNKSNNKAICNRSNYSRV